MHMLIQMFFEPIPDDEWHYPGMWTIRKNLVKSAETLLNASRQSKEAIEKARIELAIATVSSFRHKTCPRSIGAFSLLSWL